MTPQNLVTRREKLAIAAVYPILKEQNLQMVVVLRSTRVFKWEL